MDVSLDCIMRVEGPIDTVGSRTPGEWQEFGGRRQSRSCMSIVIFPCSIGLLVPEAVKILMHLYKQHAILVLAFVPRLA